MTVAEIKEYRDAIGKEVQLFGYTSTSMNKNMAEKFAWENEILGKKRVLFRIEWCSVYNHMFLDMGAFNDEEEMLL